MTGVFVLQIKKLRPERPCTTSHGSWGQSPKAKV